MAVQPRYEFPDKTPDQQQLVNDALQLLAGFGINLAESTLRQKERMGMLLCALADMRTPGTWGKAKDITQGHALSTKQVLNHYNTHFGESLSPGSYDDVKRHDLVRLEQIGLAVVNLADAATNNPSRRYGLDAEYAAVMRRFGSLQWQDALRTFTEGQQGRLVELAARRAQHMVPVTFPDGMELTFTPGAHNQLQKAVIEEFLPRYGFGARVLYVGDTARKMLLHDQSQLSALGVGELAHGDLPDIIAYSSDKNWLYLIEAVHSYGPISDTRKVELERLTAECTAHVVYVTAFADRVAFRKDSSRIAWETEVWIANDPVHLIHFNGPKFLGPYEEPE